MSGRAYGGVVVLAAAVVCAALGAGELSAQPACLKPLGQDAYGTRFIEAVKVEGERISFCVVDDYDATTWQCFTYDLAAKTWATLPDKARKKVEVDWTLPADPRVTTGDGGKTFQACPTPQTCRTFDLSHGQAGNEGAGFRGRIALNPAGTTLAALLYIEGEAQHHAIELYDAATGKRLAQQPVGDINNACLTLEWLGEALVVDGNVCAGPGGTSWLINPKNGRVRKHVGSGLNLYGGFRTHLDGTRWAFMEAFQRAIRFVDVKSAKITGTVKLAQLTDDGAPQEGLFGAAALDPGRVAFIFGEPKPGLIAIVDTRKNKILSTVELPTCSK